MIKHEYPGTAVNFLLGAKVVGSIFHEYIAELASVNTTWTPEYSSGLKIRIDDIAGEYLGVSVRDKLYKLTGSLNQSIATVKDDMVTLRRNIESDFKKSADYQTIKSDLGLTKSIYDLNQSELIAALAKAKRSLTTDYITKITAKGMPVSLLERIIESASTIAEINNEQEALKSTLKDATGKMVTTLNELFTEIMKICKLAADFYKKDSTKKSMFTFTKIMSNLGVERAPRKKKEQTVS